MANKQHIIAIRTALSRLKFTEDVKETLVSTFTNGKTISLRDMNDREASELRNHLNGIQREADASAQKMRSKVISKYHEMDFHTYSPVKQKFVADMPRIEKHLVDNWGKELNGYDNKELSRILSVLEKKIVPWYLKNKSKNEG